MNIHQKVAFGQETKSEILKGAEILYKAVKSTMGPSGHSVIIDTGTGAPFITKDGVTVAKAINLKEKLPSIGAELLKEVASKTNEMSGDGSTTSTVLGYAMLEQGVKMLATKRSPLALRKGMDLATGKAIELLKNRAISVRDKQDTVSVATISANGDKEIGNLIADAVEAVGANGIITVEPAKSVQTVLELVDGMQVESGYLAPYFVTNQEKLSCELENPYVLITNKKLSDLKDIVGILEKVLETQKPLIVVADEVEGEVLHTLVVNKMKGVLFSCAIKLPAFGDARVDLMHDLSALTGATVIDASTELSLKDLELEHLGTCKKIISGKKATTFIGCSDEQTKERIKFVTDSLNGSLKQVGLDDKQKERVKKRLAKLSGGIAIMKVGGSTEVEILEKKDRVDDALNATIAAVQEGILPGGGVSLFHVACDLEKAIKNKEEDFGNLSEDELAGVRIVIEACKEPLKVIVENTGKSPDVIMNRLVERTDLRLYSTEEEKETMKVRFGYDAYNHEFCDLIERSILDPLKVERYALEHACSVIGLMLTCNAVVMNEEMENVQNA